MNTEITKHTVGPWTIAKVGTEHLRIASTKIPLEIAVITNLKGGMKEANAHLIAAAPELLEALLTIEHEMGKVIFAKAFDEFSDRAKVKLQAALLKAIPARSEIAALSKARSA